ncbi:shikimate dehydrogenase [Colwellia sp. 1_MG-2023]|uniref:shikimate dehydrogenase n=1 Tax=Colwellia sp. 1_MG-2023 TaxID=3062649 RepID=UPI0026E2913D|nr:shikimate dehydrogenase [Colwellia sp. 1_MG-2023]MDO6446661.1 shikimate dehydrogenase [Colwellia sp. 1_MG-2023]
MDQYRVFGNPIKQSRSPFIHQKFAEQTNEQLNYQSEYVEIGEFAQAVQHLISVGGKGANVTAPFKEEAMALCDKLTERAKLAGAVNTLSFVNGEVWGDTTDGDGLVNDLLANDVVLKNKKILLLGAGGAAKGVILPLLEQSPAQLVVANRTVSKAEAIIQQYPKHPITCCSFEEVTDHKFDVIINATSAGLNGQALPISEEVIQQNVTCYDMTYGKTLTPFLQLAKQRNAVKLIDGLGMLVGQAAVSFAIWRNTQPETKQVLALLREEILK